MSQVMAGCGSAITIVVLAFLTASVATSAVDTPSQLTSGALDTGSGSYLTVLATLAAIWPLVVLRRDSRAAPAAAAPPAV